MTAATHSLTSKDCAKHSCQAWFKDMFSKTIHFWHLYISLHFVSKASIYHVHLQKKCLQHGFCGKYAFACTNSNIQKLPLLLKHCCEKDCISSAKKCILASPITHLSTNILYYNKTVSRILNALSTFLFWDQTKSSHSKKSVKKKQQQNSLVFKNSKITD